MSGAWCTSCTFGTISMLRVVCVAITLSGVWAGVNEASKKILEENARRLGVVTLEPGLQYRILPEGHCEHSCLAGTLCQFHYAEAERRATISVIEKVDESKQKKSDFMCTCRMPITFASSQTDGNERNEIDIAWQRGTLTTSAPSQADENRRHELDSTQNRASFNTFAPSEVYDFARPARAPTISVGGKNLRLYHRARVAFRTTRRSRRKEELRRRKHRRHLRLVMAALLAAKQIQDEYDISAVDAAGTTSRAFAEGEGWCSTVVCGMDIEQSVESLEQLGISSVLARRAMQAFPNDVERAANWAIDSAARHKVPCVREAIALAPRALSEAFEAASQGASR
eukprot:s1359_g5.t1